MENVRLVSDLDNPFFSHFIKNKKSIAAVLLVILGIVLIFSSSITKSKKADIASDDISIDAYKERLEAEIAALCSSVDGVGACKVYITFERGEQNVYKGSSVIETKPPKVQGVSVVCRGAESDVIKSRLTEMLTALFDIGSNRVAILKLNS